MTIHQRNAQLPKLTSKTCLQKRLGKPWTLNKGLERAHQHWSRLRRGLARRRGASVVLAPRRRGAPGAGRGPIGRRRRRAPGPRRGGRLLRSAGRVRRCAGSGGLVGGLRAHAAAHLRPKERKPPPAWEACTQGDSLNLNWLVSTLSYP